MSVVVKSELLAVKELMSDLLRLDPRQLVGDLYESGVIGLHEATETLDETLPLPTRMFFLLKNTFNPYRDMDCTPFMAFVVAPMKYNPSLTLRLRQKEVKIEQALSSQSRVRQELFSTYQSIFFDDFLLLFTQSCRSNIGSLLNPDEFLSEVSMITHVDVSKDIGQNSSDKKDITYSNKIMFHNIPSLVDELDNKKLAEVLDTVEMKYQELIENKSWRSYRKFTLLLKPYCNTIPLLLETMYCSRIRRHMRQHMYIDALELSMALFNSNKCMKKSDRVVINVLCLMGERFSSLGCFRAAENYFIPALQMASHKTVRFTKIKLLSAVATYFARGYYTTERYFWLRPGYGFKERWASEWFRTLLSLLISHNHSTRQTIYTSLLFAEFLIQSRWYHGGALRLEPRKIPIGQRFVAKNLLDFVEARLEGFTRFKRQQTLFLVTKFDYGICCKNYGLSLAVHQQGVNLGNDVFTDLLYSWLPFGEPPLPHLSDLALFPPTPVPPVPPVRPVRGVGGAIGREDA